MSKQKYQKGERVKVLIGRPVLSPYDHNRIIDAMPQLTEDIATVEYTYGEKSETDWRYSKIKDGYKQYSLNFDKYGSISWFDEDVIYKGL